MNKLERVKGLVVVWNPHFPRRKPELRYLLEGGYIQIYSATYSVDELLKDGFTVKRVYIKGWKPVRARPNMQSIR